MGTSSTTPQLSEPSLDLSQLLSQLLLLNQLRLRLLQLWKKLNSPVDEQFCHCLEIHEVRKYLNVFLVLSAWLGSGNQQTSKVQKNEINIFKLSIYQHSNQSL